MQKMVICWLLQATFTQVLSCLFRINHKDWVFSSESFEKYCEPNCGFIPRHDCSTGQEWMRKQGKGNTQTLTNRSRDVQNAKWTGAQKKSHFWHIWHAQSFWGKSNNCTPLNEKMGKREMWEKWNLKPRKSFQKNLREPRYFQYLILQVIYYTKIVFDDSGWSDFADLIREERVHLANEASNLVKH